MTALLTRRTATAFRLIVWAAAGWVLTGGAAFAQRPGPPPPLRAPKSKLLLPPGAALLFDELREEDEMEPPPPGAAGTRRERIFRAVFAEGLVNHPVSLEAVTDLYRHEGWLLPHQKPVLMHSPRPVVRMPRPEDATGMPPAAGRRPGIPAPPRPQMPVITRTAVFDISTPRGALAITTIHEGPQSPTRIRVVHLAGTMPPDRALFRANELAESIIGSRLNLAVNAPPLPPGSARASAVLHVPKELLPEVSTQVQSQLPPGVREPLRAILQQANGMTVARYRLNRELSDVEFFQFYQGLAKREKWQAVVENPVRPGAPSVIYQLPENQGVLCVNAWRQMETRPLGGGGIAIARPVTYLTVIQIQGEIDLGRLLPFTRKAPEGRPAPEPRVPPRDE